MDAQPCAVAPPPSSRCLYVFAVVLLLLVIGSLLTAFLFPRDVKVYIPAMNSTDNNWYQLVNQTSDDVAALEVEVRPCKWAELLSRNLA